jgi:hypothetical protein
LSYVKNLEPVITPDYYQTGIECHQGMEGMAEPQTLWQKIGVLASKYFPARPGEHHEVVKITRLTGGIDVKVIADGVCDDGIIENKTTSRANEHTIASQALSNQLRLYAYAFDKRRVFLRLIKKSAIRQKVSENEQMFEARYLGEYVNKPNEHFLEIDLAVDPANAVEEFIATNSMISHCSAAQIWPKAAPYSCYSMMPCTFLKYCSDPETYGSLYKVKEIKSV